MVCAPNAGLRKDAARVEAHLASFVVRLSRTMEDKCETEGDKGEAVERA